MLEKTSVSSYHQTDTLLFQFVLHEYLTTLEEAALIKKMTLDVTEETLYFQKLTLYLIKLAGSEKEYMRIFAWIQHSGVLTKLKNYCDLLSERAAKSDPDFIKLHNIVHKAWLDCLHTLDFIRNHQEGLTSKIDSIQSLKDLVEKTLTSIHKLKPVIKRIFPKYANDENVLYFILRHQDRFDHALGKGWTKRLLKKLQPEHLFTILKTAYDKRGFENLIPDIAENIEFLNREQVPT